MLKQTLQRKITFLQECELELDENVSPEQILAAAQASDPDDWDVVATTTHDYRMITDSELGVFCGGCAMDFRINLANPPTVELLERKLPQARCDNSGCGIEAHVRLSARMSSSLED